MNQQIICESTFDNNNRYEVQAVRVAPYQGKLLIREADQEIYSQRVGLMFDTLWSVRWRPILTSGRRWQLTPSTTGVANSTCARRRTPAGTG
jgi:hypothetical protein